MGDDAQDAAIAQRYGRTPAARSRSRLFGILVAVGVIGASLAWVVWAGLLTPGASLETRDLGYRTLDGAVDVRFEVSTDPGETVSCALQALNQQFAIVGWRIVDLPASDVRTRQFAETVRIAEPAVTGLIYRCWLT